MLRILKSMKNKKHLAYLEINEYPVQNFLVENNFLNLSRNH